MPEFLPESKRGRQNFGLRIGGEFRIADFGLRIVSTGAPGSATVHSAFRNPKSAIPPGSTGTAGSAAAFIPHSAIPLGCREREQRVRQEVVLSDLAGNQVADGHTGGART